MKKSIVYYSRPELLLLATISYCAGAGITHYLGRKVTIVTFFYGLVEILALLSAANLLDNYFNLSIVPLEEGETFIKREQNRIRLLQISFAVLSISAIALLVMLLSGSLTSLTGILFVMMVFSLGTFSIPALKVKNSGFRELILAINLGTLIPAFAFFLQHDQYHRLLPIATFPLTLLAIALFLVLDFSALATTQRLDQQSMLTWLTWQRAVPIHHLLVLGSYLLYSICPLVGYPWRLIWPIFLALPFAVAQIIWLQIIANGGHPIWRIFNILAYVSFGLVTYLLAMTFWFN